MKKILFELTKGHGTPIFNDIKEFPDEMTDSDIHAAFQKWEKEKLDEIEGDWRVWRG